MNLSLIPDYATTTANSNETMMTTTTAPVNNMPLEQQRATKPTASVSNSRKVVHHSRKNSARHTGKPSKAVPLPQSTITYQTQTQSTTQRQEHEEDGSATGGQLQLLGQPQHASMATLPTYDQPKLIIGSKKQSSLSRKASAKQYRIVNGTLQHKKLERPKSTNRHLQQPSDNNCNQHRSHSQTNKHLRKRGQEIASGVEKGQTNQQQQQEQDILQALCAELDVTDYSDLLAKVRELKANQNKFKKEKRLIANMKMLVKDSNELSSAQRQTKQPSIATIKSPPSTANFSTIDNTTKVSKKHNAGLNKNKLMTNTTNLLPANITYIADDNNTNSTITASLDPLSSPIFVHNHPTLYQTVGDSIATTNLTSDQQPIHHNTATRRPAHQQDDSLPKAKEVWRWVKNLMQDHFALKDQLQQYQHQQQQYSQQQKQVQKQPQSRREQ